MSNAVEAVGIPVALLAHQGGWDEVLLVLGPIAVVAGLLALARRRVTRERVDDSSPDGGEPVSRSS